MIKFDFRKYIPKDQYVPICISKGALGDDLPKEDIFLSRKHRVEYKNKFYECGDLVKMKELENKIYLDYNHNNLVYYHIEMDNHYVINVSGINSESMYEFYNKNIPDDIGHHKKQGQILTLKKLCM